MSQILEAAQMARSGQVLKLRAQVVVVGLGAGGAAALRELALGGVDVLGLEAGPRTDTADMNLREHLMLPRLLAEAGARATDDYGVRVVQGRGVGGSTLHNTNLCARLPDAIAEQWADELGLGWLLGDSMEADWQAMERLLEVTPIPDHQINAHNRLFEAGAQALGYRTRRLAHNRGAACQGSGFCTLGCPNGGKRHGAAVLVPEALQAGARVLCEARIDRVLVRHGAVYGVSGYAVDPDSRLDLAPVVVEAERVILAASATGSAVICQRSGLPDPCRLMGTNLHLHPGAAVLGFFDEPGASPLEAWRGVPQSVGCDEFMDHSLGTLRRVWLVPGFAHPAMAATMMPGFGPALAGQMRRYRRSAAVIAMLHDHSSGAVKPGRGEKVHLRYQLDALDLEQLALGLREAARVLLAAGASQVLVPLHPPLLLDDPQQLALIQPSALGLMSPALTAAHPMSTLWMGEDPLRSVVDSQGQHHHTRGLYVADGSLLPTSVGVPPQLTIYTLGRRVGRAVKQTF